MRCPSHPVVVIVAVVCAFAAGCSRQINMMPTPVVFQGGRVNLFDSVPADKQRNTLEVLYATERAPRGPTTDREYTNSVSGSLRVGEATVRFGDDKTNWQQLVDASLAEKRAKQIHLQLVQAREVGEISPSPRAGGANPSGLTPAEQAFADRINDALAQTAEPQVCIYVHGFRVDFEEGMAVAAQLRHFLGRRQVVIAYAWPCRQGLLDYTGDVERAIDSGPNLARLMEFLAAHTKAKQINLLGYSAGATLVVEGLANLRERYSDLNEEQLREKLRVGNVVLAAADIGLKSFVKEHLDRIADVPRYIEITMSSSDQALKMASRLRGGGSRIGRANVKELTEQQIEEVSKVTKLYALDVTSVKGPHSEPGGIGGHGYWYVNSWVSSDVLTTLIWQLPPDQRGLVRVPGKRSWTFPPDYPDRVHGFVTEKVQDLRQKLDARAAGDAAGQ